MSDLGDSGSLMILQMDGSGYRRLNGAERFARFRPLVWWTSGLALIALGYTALLLDHSHNTEPAWSFLVYFCIFIAAFGGGAWVMPSAFGHWLHNTARRGYLRDLVLAGIDITDILRAHFHARIGQIVANFWLYHCYLLGRLMGAVHTNSLQEVMVALAVLILIAASLSVYLLVECHRYRLAVAPITQYPWRITLLIVGCVVFFAIAMVWTAFCQFVLSPALVGSPPVVGTAALLAEASAIQALQTGAMAPLGILLAASYVGQGYVGTLLPVYRREWQAMLDRLIPLSNQE